MSRLLMIMLVALAVTARLDASAQVDSTNGCLACHTAQREGAVVGAHAEHGVRCIDCHGGNVRARTLPAAHQGRFVSGKDKVATYELCGSCHSDPNRMRQYGLRSGEPAEFKTSRHGQLLLVQHDPNAPTCTSCHSTHVIYPPEDARSNVYPTNIPGTCARCHADRQLMAKYKIPTTQFEQYRRSAHGIALYQGQNFASPTCVGCHGAHSALPPTVTEVASGCGRCHQLVRAAFAAGPHGAVASSARFPGCLGCHSNHGTERVTPDSIVVVCTKCHGADTRIRTMALQIQKTVVTADSDLVIAQRAVGQLALGGRRVSDYRFRYQSALSYYLEIAQVQHSLNLDELDDLGRRVHSISVELTSAAQASADIQGEHKLLLGPVWFLGLAAIALGWLMMRGLKEAGEDRER
ncbi:MAG TPA: multiheme c-type cytochrome [Gemmatimonadales bacterium]|nr:multiheme c-type cytochrome [Gemmatimonadales bacterium]